MLKELINSGTYVTILVYVDHRDNAPVLEFVNSLTENEQRLLFQLLKTFCNTQNYVDTTKFRNEGDQIYAFKRGACRLLCFFLPDQPKKTVVLTHGYRKQSQKLPKQEKQRALAIYQVVKNELKETK